MYYKTILINIFALLFSFSSYAIRESRPTPGDSRIRVMVYSPDDVFKFTGYYGYQASIELAKEEEVANVSMGDSTSWQIVPSGNRLFIKPMERDATTNMTLITNKRTYFFELYAEEAIDIRDPNMVFSLRFIYPDEEDFEDMKTYSNIGKFDGVDMNHPERYNFNYSISGNEDIAPVKIFDDGEFTYLQFRGPNKEIPAFFSVDEDLREYIVNYRLSTTDPNLIIIEHVFPKISVRLGSKIVCIFNEGYKYLQRKK